jgi:hypothetical protein
MSKLLGFSETGHYYCTEVLSALAYLRYAPEQGLSHVKRGVCMPPCKTCMFLLLSMPTANLEEAQQKAVETFLAQRYFLSCDYAIRSVFFHCRDPMIRLIAKILFLNLQIFACRRITHR